MLVKNINLTPTYQGYPAKNKKLQVNPVFKNTIDQVSFGNENEKKFELEMTTYTNHPITLERAIRDLTPIGRERFKTFYDKLNAIAKKDGMLPKGYYLKLKLETRYTNEPCSNIMSVTLCHEDLLGKTHTEYLTKESFESFFNNQDNRNLIEKLFRKKNTFNFDLFVDQYIKEEISSKIDSKNKDHLFQQFLDEIVITPVDMNGDVNKEYHEIIQRDLKTVFDQVKLNEALRLQCLSGSEHKFLPLLENSSTVESTDEISLKNTQKLFSSKNRTENDPSSLINLFKQALEALNNMNTNKPFLSGSTVTDYANASKARMPEKMNTPQNTITEIMKYFEGLINPVSPKFSTNVLPPPTTVSVVASALTAMQNPNIIWDHYSQKIAKAEVEVAAMIADLIGFDPEKASGVFTSGGTSCNKYAARIGISKAFPDSMKTGVNPEKTKIITSSASHYSTKTLASWLGVGEDNLISIPTTIDNSMDIKILRDKCVKEIKQGNKIACIFATMGTTDSLGMDNLRDIVEMRDDLVREFSLDYKPHIHADAAIGWAWSVFNDYDWNENPLKFDNKTIEYLQNVNNRIKDIQLADSASIDFHKTGYTPYISSLIMVKDKDDFMRLARNKEKMPYLFQDGNYQPGVYTEETSRGGTGVMAALANLITLGKEGYRTLLAHNVKTTTDFRAMLLEDPSIITVNSDNYGPVTLFRVYPESMDGLDTYMKELNDPENKAIHAKINEYNRKIYRYINNKTLQGKATAISITDNYRNTPYGEPIVALKQFVISPFTETKHSKELYEEIKEAQKAVKFEDIKV